jgi:argininosuccinate lyase
MPQKRNPVAIEHARLLASLSAGRAETALSVVHNTPFTDMNDSEGEVQAACHAAFSDGGRALDLVAGLVRAVRIDSARVAVNLDRGCATITELADTLVRDAALSFRQAHEICAATAKAVVAAGTSLRDGGYRPFADAFHRATGGAGAIDEARFREVVSPEHFVAVRTRPGGPAMAPMQDALAAYRIQAAGFAEVAGKIERREREQARVLDQAFLSLAN